MELATTNPILLILPVLTYKLLEKAQRTSKSTLYYLCHTPNTSVAVSDIKGSREVK